MTIEPLSTIMAVGFFSNQRIIVHIDTLVFVLYQICVLMCQLHYIKTVD